MIIGNFFLCVLASWLLEAWELLNKEKDYIVRGWAKCGMGEVLDPRFQDDAAKQVYRLKLLSDEALNKEMDLVVPCVEDDV